MLDCDKHRSRLLLLELAAKEESGILEALSQDRMAVADRDAYRSGWGASARGVGHVLVVDDEARLCGSVEKALARCGHIVVSVRNGVDALRRLADSEFDVVITDLQMPGMNGVDVLRTIHQTAPETEVILATAYPSLEVAIQCLRAGAFDLIEKPFRLEELEACVARALRQRNVRYAASLSSATQMIFSATDRETLPERIVDLSMRVIGADEVALFLPDPIGQLRVAHAATHMATARPDFRLGMMESLATIVADARTPRILPALMGLDDPRLEPYLETISSCIGYPLISGESVLGLLLLSRIQQSRSFCDADLQRTAVLASQVVLALENARLVRTLVTSEQLAAVGQLAAGVAHEINNPAAYVLANVEHVRHALDAHERILRRSPEEAALWFDNNQIDLREALDDAESGARRIAAIVKDMQRLSRGDQEDRTPVELIEVIESAARVALVQDREGVSLEIDLPEEGWVWGNSGQLSQVFVNLMVNAVHAMTPSGDEEIERKPLGKRLRVLWDPKSSEESIRICVIDDGSGIEPHYLHRIFDPFFTTKPRGVGTGLGLSITRDIIEHHGGQIWATSPAEGGTCFTVALPRIQKHDALRESASMIDATASSATTVLENG